MILNGDSQVEKKVCFKKSGTSGCQYETVCE